ncbi:MAG: plasmid pRiA4b ORF-3 family protein [Waterburya sp.]
MTNSKTIYQLKISLRDIRPPIWRRVQVQSSTTLSDLHLMIQAAMGWYNCHLHSFSIQGIEYGKPEPDYGLDLRDENKAKLSSVIKQEKSKFSYIYDFGDSWEHSILVEKILPKEPKVSYPLCIKAKRACPPEDCGGAWGYMEFLEAMQDPNHPEHENFQEWIEGNFNSEFYDLQEINQRLADFESLAQQYL